MAVVLAETDQKEYNLAWLTFRENDKQVQLTAVFKQVPEGYVGFVEELPGANTQGATLEETRTNLMEAIQMVLEANRVLAQESLKGQDVIREPVIITAA
jgi:predicted RNase H-like HicB family nuclease